MNNIPNIIITSPPFKTLRRNEFIVKVPSMLEITKAVKKANDIKIIGNGILNVI